MGLIEEKQAIVAPHTLIRKVGSSFFDVVAVCCDEF